MKQIGFFLVSILIHGLMISQLYGQVVTPSLNIISKPVMPASSSWLKIDSVGGEYTDGNGKRKLNGEDINNLDVESTYGILAFSFGDLDVAGYIEEATFDTKHDTTFDGSFLNDSSETYLSLSLTGQGNVTVGAAFHEVNKNVFVSSPDYENENFKHSGILASFSIKIADFLFLGGGIERIKETSTLTIDNGWTDVTGGIALWFGQETDTQFRVEISATESPESKSEADQSDTMLSAEHPNSRTNRLNIELMMNGLLFSIANTNKVFYHEYTNSDTGESADQSEDIINEGSVQWIPEDGLVLGFSFKSFEHKEIYQDKIESFKINLGFKF